jgi:uncharacterized delta-60 repeat protein
MQYNPIRLKRFFNSFPESTSLPVSHTVRLLYLLWLLVGLLWNGPASAQLIDPTFNPGIGANGTTDIVRSMARQPNGKVLIGGAFLGYFGPFASRSRIARINANGTLDLTFDPGTGADSDVKTIVLQPDGKVLIGGFFTTYNGTSRNRIARLNADGTLDTGFNPGTGADGVIRTLALQADGKVLIGGDFIAYNGTSRPRIARVNTDGTLDMGFTVGTGADSRVQSFALQPDGKVLIGGQFTTYNNFINQNGIARLNTDGTIDGTFRSGTGATDVAAMLLQPDGKALIGGGFTAYNGTAFYYLARVNADGSTDTGFNPGTGVNQTLYSVVPQPDGKVLIGGRFTTLNGLSRNYIARLNANGTLDASFNTPGTGLNGAIGNIALQPDGKLLIGGIFTFYNGTSRRGIARLNADGTLDTGFDTGLGTIGNGGNADLVASLALQPDGKVLMAGAFGSYNSTIINRVAGC